jgi:hypothetical protein
MGKV